jgi:hypothetical protein
MPDSPHPLTLNSPPSPRGRGYIQNGFFGNTFSLWEKVRDLKETDEGCELSNQKNLLTERFC